MERGESPGIMFSGMDILDEIDALIHGRSLGEVKLTTEENENVMFTLGVGLTKTRLTGEEITKNFALKTAAERAVPNALHHELLSKH